MCIGNQRMNDIQGRNQAGECKIEFCMVGQNIDLARALYHLTLVSDTTENEVVGMMVGAEYKQVMKQMQNAPEEVHITTHDENDKQFD